MTGSIELSIQYDDMTGHIYLAERGEKTGTTLADTSADNWLILYLKTEGGDGVTINLSAHDVENVGTSRAFHTKLTVHLDWDDARKLRDFLDASFNLLKDSL